MTAVSRRGLLLGGASLAAAEQQTSAGNGGHEQLPSSVHVECAGV